MSSLAAKSGASAGAGEVVGDGASGLALALGSEVGTVGDGAGTGAELVGD
jgi:hypothetical protein